MAVLFVCLLLAVLAGTRAEQCCVKVDKGTKQLIDAEGRARLFHGVNVVYKRFPYHPSNASFDPELSLSSEDISFLVDNGFNVVRLYVAWPGVEPSEDHYNITYLQVIEDYVNRLGAAGIYSILDCHQDLLSPKFCGEGVPDYAVLYLNRSVKPFKFPVPIPSLSPYPVDPNTGYPYRSDCKKHSFFTYYFSDAEGKAWQSLYDNEQGVQDHFIQFWQTVALKFNSNPYVLGYELINEPWAGDIYSHPNQLEPHVADLHNLQPMYSKLHDAIRKYDNEHIIFFEPTVIITSLPLEISSTGFTQGPGGPHYNDRQVLSYHMYCILLDSNGQPRDTRVCDLTDDGVMKIRVEDMNKLGVAGFMTEWGAYDNETVPSSKPYDDGLELTRLADKFLQSWTYWQYKGYGDFTTQSSIAEGLWYRNGTVQSSKVKLLSRTYAQSVTGRYVNHNFDPSTGDFSVTFAANVSVSSQQTRVFLNEKYYYPSGYSVSISPAGAASYTTAHNLITVSLNTTTVQTGDEVTVAVKANAK